MNYREYRPRHELREVVELYWTMDNLGSAAAVSREHVIVDTGIEVFFNFGDGYTRSEAPTDGAATWVEGSHVVGFRHRPIVVSQAGTVSIFGIRFRPEGIARLVRFPLSEITHRIVDLHEVFGSEAAPLEQRLYEASGASERIAIVETAMLSRLHEAPRDLAMASLAVSLIRSSHGRVTVAAVADRLDLGYKQLERAFRRRIGVTPKTFAQIVRFQNAAAQLLRRRPGDAWFPSGYYDQPHFIREFTRFAGITPSAFRARSEQISSYLLESARMSNSYNTQGGANE
jgi:AraC-like DNA-binding protein